MTTALWTPRQREIARTTDPYAPKPCKIYGFMVRDPWAGMPGRTGAPIVGYVGESERDPELRRKEHELDKWWARDILAFFVLRDKETGEELVWPNKAAVWAEERRLVEKYQPPYNLEYNGSNKWLIKDGRGVHQDLPPQPAWWPTSATAAKQPPKQHRAVAAPKVPRPGWTAPPWLCKVKRRAWQLAGLVVIAVAVWIWLAATHQAATAKDGAGMGGVASFAVALAIHWVRKKLHKGRRRRR
jgi:hypothetical protein